MDNKFEYKKAQNKKFEKILIALMITALVALPLIYKAQSYAEAEEGLKMCIRDRAIFLPRKCLQILKIVV